MFTIKKYPLWMLSTVNKSETLWKLRHAPYWFIDHFVNIKSENIEFNHISHIYLSWYKHFKYLFILINEDTNWENVLYVKISYYLVILNFS